MWNTYYKEWIDQASSPQRHSLIVRYEDILFNPKLVVTKVCTCAGGIINKNFQHIETSAKAHGNSINGAGAPRQDSNTCSIIYGTKAIRDSILSELDKKFTRENLDQSIMKIFNYSQ